MKSRFDPNDIIIHKDYCEIVLGDIKGNEVARALIDLEDLELIKQYKWSRDMNSHGVVYAKTKVNNSTIRMHSLILNTPKGKQVDHINHNGLDNRKSNLRICNNTQNSQNKGLQKNNTTGIAGVSWIEKRQRYECRIYVNGKKKFLGYVKTLEEAKALRDKAEEEYFNEFKYGSR